MTACSPRSSMSSDPRPRGPAPSNVELALEAVRGAIVDGRLRPGERIKEVPLAQDLGFSRAPVRAGERRRARDAADADLAYQQSIVTAAELPRVSTEFERLTWQVRMFLGALDIDVLDNLERVVAEVQALHEAIVERDVLAAERLWREKFERWITDLVGRLDE